MPNLNLDPDLGPEAQRIGPDQVAPSTDPVLDLSHQRPADPIEPSPEVDPFQADWVFEIHRDKANLSLIQVRGAQTDHLYFEVSDKTDASRYDAWHKAEALRDDLQARKLPSFTWDKAFEMETSFMVQEDYESEPSICTVVGYRTKFNFFTSMDRRKAGEMKDDLSDLKLTAEEKVLQVHAVKAHGGFPVLGKNLSVGDPTCGMGRDACVPAARGTWNGFSVQKDADDWGKRNAVLLALKDDFSPLASDAWEEFGVVGVDGGMAAITAEAYDREDEHNNEYNDGLCGASGVQCSSGFGDGGYGAYAIKRDGVAVAVGVVFLAPLERYEKAYLDTAVAAALRQG